MNHEFGIPFDPEFENSEHIFSSLVVAPSFLKLAPIKEHLGETYESVILEEAGFMDWSTLYRARGYRVCGVSADSGIATEVNSSLYDATRFGGAKEDWIDDYRRFKFEAGDKKPCMTVEYKPGMANLLQQITSRIGLGDHDESYDAILNLGAYHISTAFEMSKSGLFIVAYTEIEGEKMFNAWESRYNNRFDRNVESSIVDSISVVELKQINLPIKLAP